MMFDEQPHGDIHGECAAAIHDLQDMLAWTYSKLHRMTFNNMDDALMMDRIKMFLEHGIRA